VASTHPGTRILVIAADLRSAIGNSLPPNATRADIVSASLFRDAASAALVASSDRLYAHETPLWEIISGGSRIVEDTRSLVDYREEDDGAIRLHLSPKLPDAVAAAEPAFVASLCAKAKAEFGSAIPPVQEMAVLCHTGGPKILREVAQCLKVDESHLKSSWSVMKAHGNLSGASNLAVLDHYTRNALDRGEVTWAVCLSMGPGVCLEGVLLRPYLPHSSPRVRYENAHGNIRAAHGR
jgi:alkylresorcinol/alkylpyrone synthase